MLDEMFQQNASLCLPMPYFECMDNFEVIYFTGTIHYSINLIFMKRALKGGDQNHVEKTNYLGTY